MLYQCPYCQVSLEIEEEWRGMEVSCPVCGKDFTICETSPKKNGMITAWVLYGISQLVHSCTRFVSEILHYRWYVENTPWKETVHLRETLYDILAVTYRPTQFLIFLATIFTIIYMNRSSNNPVAAGGQATLKRIKSAAVICGISFAASNIVPFLTSHVFLNYLSVSSKTFRLINCFTDPLGMVSTLAESLAIIFTVKYWIWKKSQIDQ